MATASIKAVRELGSDGMANTCELLINVVSQEQAKDAERLEPTGTVDRYGSCSLSHRRQHGHRRASPGCSMGVFGGCAPEEPTLKCPLNVLYVGL